MLCRTGVASFRFVFFFLQIFWFSDAKEAKNRFLFETKILLFNFSTMLENFYTIYGGYEPSRNRVVVPTHQAT
jgi:hypothetical protein